MKQKTVFVQVVPKKAEIFEIECPYCNSKSYVDVDFGGMWNCDECEKNFICTGEERDAETYNFTIHYLYVKDER